MSILRTAQQEVDTHMANLDILGSLSETLRNPDKALAAGKKLIEMNTIAAERKAEADKAEATIALAEKMAAEIEESKTKHAEYLETTYAALAARQEEIASLSAQLDAKREQISAEVDEAMAERKAQLDAAEKELVDRQTKLMAREAKFRDAIAG